MVEVALKNKKVNKKQELNEAVYEFRRLSA